MSLSNAARRVLMSGARAVPRELASTFSALLHTGIPYDTAISRDEAQRTTDDGPSSSGQRIERQTSQCASGPFGIASLPSNGWWPVAAPSLARSLHCTAAPTAAEANDGGGGGDGGGGRGAPAQQPVSNPLQAALNAAAGASGGAAAHVDGLTGASRAAAAAGTSGRRRPRLWMWYDEADEREERRKERQRSKYNKAGTAYLMGVPQSMKKMNRIVRLVRGLSYSEAVAQCQMVPHKAAKYVLQALERAREDAIEKKGLDGDRLVVGIIFVTKGMYTKESQPMGKGTRGRMYTRTSHLRVVLSEARGRAQSAFSGRVVAPLMSTFARSPGWLAAAAAGRDGRPPPRRFAYRLEV